MNGPLVLESIDLGTTRLPRKPIAYRKVAKKTAYAITPYIKAMTLPMDRPSSSVYWVSSHLP
jgi:hypothetical protein